MRHDRPKKRILLALALCLSAGLTVALTIEGRVVGVADGDTVTVLDAGKVQHKVRLTGIDASEKAQPFGQRSKQNLSTWVFGRQVQVEMDKLDRYGRTLGKVVVNGIDANLELVKAGFAWHYKKYAAEQSAKDREAYARAEMVARTQRLELWHDAAPLPPWDWRSCGRHKPGTEAMDCGLARRWAPRSTLAVTVNEGQRLGGDSEERSPGLAVARHVHFSPFFKGRVGALIFFAALHLLCLCVRPRQRQTHELQSRKDVSQKKKPLAIARGFPSLVPGRGLEPPHLSAHGPEPCASTNSAIRA